MTGSAVFRIFLNFVVFLGLQWLLLRNVSFGNMAFCFAYIGAVMLLPIAFNPLLLLLLALAAGLATDAFYDTPGLNAAAATLAAYLRFLNTKILEPPGGYEENMEVSVSSMGLRWYLLYMLPVLYLHSFAVFMLEYAALEQIPLALLKASGSALFTLTVIMVVQNSLYRPPSTRD